MEPSPPTQWTESEDHSLFPDHSYVSQSSVGMSIYQSAYAILEESYATPVTKEWQRESENEREKTEEKERKEISTELAAVRLLHAQFCIDEVLVSMHSKGDNTHCSAVTWCVCLLWVTRFCVAVVSPSPVSLCSSYAAFFLTCMFIHMYIPLPLVICTSTHTCVYCVPILSYVLCVQCSCMCTRCILLTQSVLLACLDTLDLA